MDPPNKKRRLAPKLADLPPSAQHGAHSVADQQAHLSTDTASIPSAHDAPPPPSTPGAPGGNFERQDFEAFAKHLQDAAIYIYNQGQKVPYAQVSVLLLKWDEDLVSAAKVSSLERVLHDRYNFRTERWGIPSVPNPELKLNNKISDFVQSQDGADHLLIVYYAGHGYNASDNQLYWSFNAHEDSPKIKWEGVRTVLDNATSDVLVLLDSCAPIDAPTTGKSGTKQVIAAYGPGLNGRDLGVHHFTAYLEDALNKLGSGRPFNSKQLYKEIAAVQQARERYLSPPQPVSNGPCFFSFTPGKDQVIDLAPMPRGLHSSPRNGSGPDSKAHRRPSQEVPVVSPSAVSDMVFDEAHMLVCTTFVGEANADMANFKQWLANTPVLASRVSVEGMFLGPPTVLIISVPQSLWALIEHDKICFSLGYVNSHNLLHLYKDVMKVSTSVPELAPSPYSSASRPVAAPGATFGPSLSASSTTLPPLAAVPAFAQDMDESRTMPDARKSISTSTHSPPHRSDFHMPPLQQQRSQPQQSQHAQSLPPPPSPASHQHQHHSHHTHQQVSPHHQQQHHYASPPSDITLPPIAHAQQPLPHPVTHRRLSHHLPPPIFHDAPPVASYEPNGVNRRESLPQIQQSSSMHHFPQSHSHTLPPISSLGGPIPPKDDNEDSAEMKEAAEQLKALSRPSNGAGNDTGNGAANGTGSPPFPMSSHLSKIAQDVIKCQADEPAPEDAEMKNAGDESGLSASAKKAKPSKDYRFKAAKDTKAARARSRSDIMHTQNLPPLLPHGKQEVQCQYCSHEPFKDPSSLRKHVASAHTRPFPCAFSFAGCTSTFGSKNEWKRHIASQHLCLQYYRCSDCAQTGGDGKANEFNRKDLFTQHLRRMHAPPSIRKAIQKRDGKPETEWEEYVKEMQKTCCIIRRRPPQHSSCPRPRCTRVFEGRSAWDEWTEHVGRHMESGDAENLGVDSLLVSWALKEGIISCDEDGTYRLSNPMAGGTGSGVPNGNGNGSGSYEGAGPSPSAPLATASNASPMKNGESAASGLNGRSLSSGSLVGEDSTTNDRGSLAEISSAAFAIANARQDQSHLPPTPPLTTQSSSVQPRNGSSASGDLNPDEDALTAMAAMAAMNAASLPASITGTIRDSPQRMDTDAPANDEAKTIEAVGQAILELTRVEPAAPAASASPAVPNSRAEEWRKAVEPSVPATNGSPAVKKERKPLPGSQRRDRAPSASQPAPAPVPVPAPAPASAPVSAPEHAPVAASSIKAEPPSPPKAPVQKEDLSGLQSITMAAAVALREQESKANGADTTTVSVKPPPPTAEAPLSSTMDVD